jgi:hypothetical protein
MKKTWSKKSRDTVPLRSQGSDSNESIPPAFVAWRTGTSNRVVVPAHQVGNRFLGLLKMFTYSGSGRVAMKPLTAIAKVATALGLMPAYSDTVEPEGWQMKQCWIKYFKNNPKKSRPSHIFFHSMHFDHFIPHIWPYFQGLPTPLTQSSDPPFPLHDNVQKMDRFRANMSHIFRKMYWSTACHTWELDIVSL